MVSTGHYQTKRFDDFVEYERAIVIFFPTFGFGVLISDVVARGGDNHHGGRNINCWKSVRLRTAERRYARGQQAPGPGAAVLGRPVAVARGNTEPGPCPVDVWGGSAISAVAGRR